MRWLLLCKAGWLAGGRERVASEVLSESWERDDVGRGSSKDFSALFATVSPPPDDPLMLSASRSWLLPGQPHPVRVSFIPSMARPIAGTPLYPGHAAGEEVSRSAAVGGSCLG